MSVPQQLEDPHADVFVPVRSPALLRGHSRVSRGTRRLLDPRRRVTWRSP